MSRPTLPFSGGHYPFWRSHKDCEVKIMRIPCDGSPISIVTTPLIGIGDGGIKAEDCTENEEGLLLFPDIEVLEQDFDFRCSHRQLLCLSATNVSPVENTDHMLYVCEEEESGLPRNKILEDLSEMKMYGDGFWFMVLKGFDESVGPHFIDMRQEIVQDLYLKERGKAETVLRNLVAC